MPTTRRPFDSGYPVYRGGNDSNPSNLLHPFTQADRRVDGSWLDHFFFVFAGLASAWLVIVALVDAVGERRIQNQPGTDEEYPNWRIPLADPAGRPVGLDEPAVDINGRPLPVKPATDKAGQPKVSAPKNDTKES